MGVSKPPIADICGSTCNGFLSLHSRYRKAWLRWVTSSLTKSGSRLGGLGIYDLIVPLCPNPPRPRTNKLVRTVDISSRLLALRMRASKIRRPPLPLSYRSAIFSSTMYFSPGTSGFSKVTISSPCKSCIGLKGGIPGISKSPSENGPR